MKQPAVATLILNRNLPDVTDRLVDHIKRWSGDLTDVYVIESGSDEDKISKHCSFWANWPEALEKGLRWSQGFNYGLMELEKSGKKYDYYFLVMGDSVFDEQPLMERLLDVMNKYPRIGILSPLSPTKSEGSLFFEGDDGVKCLWLVTHVSWLVRGSMIDALKPDGDATIMNYFYDGSNFRGYYNDIEATVRGYQHDFATAVTFRVTFHEQEDLTLKNAKVMKTDAQPIHWDLMMEEGLVWMKKKYGFANKGQFKEWAAREYREFMKRNPEYQPLSLVVSV